MGQMKWRFVQPMIESRSAPKYLESEVKFSKMIILQDISVKPMHVRRWSEGLCTVQQNNWKQVNPNKIRKIKKYSIHIGDEVKAGAANNGK